MRTEYWQMGYNDYLACQDFAERPDHWSVGNWLDYLEGVRAAAFGDQ
ncbi:hypothetical protein NRB_06700 [Novosphingobium sp. 11B]